ncbi:MAG: DUF2797 domain-containing protein [Gammaproteobacteria bacterium]|nr:MAG: DUF2797 domain-containing protein [Gammaproteobacteria bacterium]
MKLQGNIRKMTSKLQETVQYFLPIADELLPMNELIGKSLRIEHTTIINCVNCGRKIKKGYQQGHCYPCMQSLASCDMCILKPETCHYAAGTCREPSWGEANCYIDHYVYIANSSGLKVGITRGTQIPTRWIDQGASQGLPIFKVKNRLHSGLIEDALKPFIADKTNWRRMLQGEPEIQDMQRARDKLLEQAASVLEEVNQQFEDGAYQAIDDAETVNINYPITEYPVKIKSFNLDKTPSLEGTLTGIKGQYLIFDTGVINMRKYAGYELAITDDV